MKATNLAADSWKPPDRLHGDSILDTPLVVASEEERHAARLAVCGAARDAAEARTFLEMLGLAP